MTNTINREHWLSEVSALIIERTSLNQLLNKKPFKVSCGFPSRSALSSKSRRLGECHYRFVDDQNSHELFISPLEDKPDRVAGILSHELCHVAAGSDANHGPIFKETCRIVGLTEGKPSSAMPGSWLTKQLLKIIDEIGPYPHTALHIPPTRSPKVSSVTRLICVDCACNITINTKLLLKCGAPICACGTPLKEK